MVKEHERPGRKEEIIDINIFQDGWNNKNAYAFGWVMSDGCLMHTGRNKNRGTIVISTNDYDIAEWLYNYMCIGNKIYVQKEKNYTVRFRNEDAISFMEKYGMVERKSLILQYPHNIPNEYFWDFIRGYFDGNGAISFHHTKYNVYGSVSFTCGSTDFANGIQEELLNRNIQNHIYKDGRPNNHSNYVVVSRRSNIKRFADLMYANKDQSMYLKRKYDKFAKLFEEHPLKYNVA